MSTYNRQAFVIRSVQGLPEPEWPHRCPVAKPLGLKNDESPEAPNERWRAKRPTLTGAEVAQCPYHEQNWVVVAAIAVAAWHDPDPLDDALIELTAMKMGHTAEQTAHAQTLFSRAIRYSEADAKYTNGIHRVCALKVAGANEVPLQWAPP